MSIMDNFEREARETGYVTVDLPVRLSGEQFARLAAAASEAQTTRSNSPFFEPEHRSSRVIERVSAGLKLRARRDAQLGGDMFGEPAWDILLDLFIGRTEGRKTNSTSASIASRAPTSTALRYLGILEQRGLITRRTAEHDMRVHYVQLTDDAYQSMLELFAD
jgi:hypothetical protein